MDTASPFGTHRAVDPAGALPYQAKRLDLSLPLKPGELLIDVERLNIDSASMTQLAAAHGHDPERVGAAIDAIVETCGKMHNPVTGSGGMLIGRVAAVGPDTAKPLAQVGDRIATLVSLTTTPLRLDRIDNVDLTSHQVVVKGQALLFENSLLAVLPDDLPETLVLAALDVCGAPAQTHRLVGPDDRVLIIGAGGKSGILCTYVAAKQVRDPRQVIAFDYKDEIVARAAEAAPGVTTMVGDATDAVGLMLAVSAATDHAMVDLVINCVNVPNTEMACILATKDRGRIYFFSMATNFQAAALGAESVGQDIDMLIGNGYARGHADFTLDLLRESEVLRRLLQGR
ncbi:MAG: L-erythro-3,5-diaminohexanoate dehydrogenase [Candidatus Sericytochromatia bacterium]|nr:L-erythro-3,5-diaminohexanoate dehydrogenase [Candidatus Sericytochromatia bacterium]